ncbi:hypothetical protein S83_030507 [Arachis hypogaea]
MPVLASVATVPASKDVESLMEPPKRREVRHLNNEDYKAKRARGGCIFCSEPYSAKHVCKNKEFKLLIMEPEAEEGDWLEQEAVPKAVEQLKLKLPSSNCHHRSFKAWDEVKGCRVRVLVYCGALNNFIEPEITAELGLIVDTTPRFSVKVADRCNSGDRADARR